MKRRILVDSSITMTVFVTLIMAFSLLQLVEGQNITLKYKPPPAVPPPRTVVPQGTCMSRTLPLDVTSFGYNSCVMCYFYLFPGKKGKLVPSQVSLIHLKSTNESSTVQMVAPDPRNESSVDAVCSTLNSDECQRWKDCCIAAETCCQRQLQLSTTVPANHCPRTWDGYGCWDDTPAGMTVTIGCPSYMEHSVSTNMGLKTCTNNATWQLYQGYPWTDYRPCLDKEKGMHI